MYVFNLQFNVFFYSRKIFLYFKICVLHSVGFHLLGNLNMLMLELYFLFTLYDFLINHFHFLKNLFHFVDFLIPFCMSLNVSSTAFLVSGSLSNFVFKSIMIFPFSSIFSDVCLFLFHFLLLSGRHILL